MIKMERSSKKKKKKKKLVGILRNFETYAWWWSLPVKIFFYGALDERSDPLPGKGSSQFPVVNTLVVGIDFSFLWSTLL
jgi:hypothetical protein